MPKLDWLTPARCRAILLALIVLGFIAHWRYLTVDCPIDLAGDEAHYWDWSRRLDLSYYSKGPLVAWIIRASCAVFGDAMWAVRLPALLLAAGTTLLTYWLARRVFESDRIALGAVALTHLVPMFMAGSLLMTIDPPFFFCWAAATCLAYKAMFDNAKWAWPAMGVMIGVGFLAKYAALLWFVGAVVFLVWEWRRPGCFKAGPHPNPPPAGEGMKARRSAVGDGIDFAPSPAGGGSGWGLTEAHALPGLSLAAIIAILFTIPVLLWNARHGWASFHHVARQTGVADTALNLLRPLEMLGGQVGVLGPTMFVLVAAACVWGARAGTKTRFLLLLGLPFFVICFLQSIFQKPQPNWPAPAYFTLVILAAGFVASRMRDAKSWRRWRGWVWATAAIGIVLAPVAHDMSMLYPLLHKLDIAPRRVDPTVKLRGWQELGARVSQELQTLRPGALVMAEDYQVASELAFYVDGHPKTYAIGSYFARPTERKRRSQFDLWPDRSLDRPVLLGKDAIYVGYAPRGQDLQNAFEEVKRLKDVVIIERGIEIRRFQVWRCRNFQGMTRPAGETKS